MEDCQEIKRRPPTLSLKYFFSQWWCERGIASLLEHLFQRKKATAKPFNDAYFANLY